MKKEKIISSILATVGILMICVAMVLQSDASVKSVSYEQIDIKSMAASSNIIVKGSNHNALALTEVDMAVAPASVIIPPRTKVYDGLTLEELAAKLDRHLTGYIAGKGELVASYCIEKGVDPYVATAIMLHETGCPATCSKLVRYCNNVGGQKGSPGCNGGSFKRYDTLDEGIYGFVNNLYKNYYSQGLNTVELIAPKYAEGNTWAGKINWYVELVKNS